MGNSRARNFYTEVIRRSSLFETPNRVDDPLLLEPVTRRRVQAILRDAGALGLGIYETYRSQQRQEQLYRAGTTQLQHVGVHHYGLAADIVFFRNGEPDWEGDFALLGHLARTHGLVWGGDWGHPWRPTAFPDLDHVQRCTLAQQPALFRGEWYPEEE